MTDHLSEGSAQIPWLAAARAEFERKRDDKYEREQQKKREAAAAEKALADKRKLESGVVIAGKRYRLVEDA